MIIFKDDKGKTLIVYDSYISNSEIIATKELLQHENKCNVTVYIKDS